MKLGGHSAITNAAISNLQRECSGHLFTVGLTRMLLADWVVRRDLVDVMTLGHWTDNAQKHHFMRRFDGQSALQGYREGVAWIRSGAEESIAELSRVLPTFFERHSKQSSPPAGPNRGDCRLPAMYSLDSEPLYRPGRDFNLLGLGNALHALQDSFAPGHVRRARPRDDLTPGAIEYVLVYEGDEKEGHGEGDKVWKERKGFSQVGRLAINASMALISAVMTTVILKYRRASIIQAPLDVFQQKWLAPSPLLFQDLPGICPVETIVAKVPTRSQLRVP